MGDYSELKRLAEAAGNEVIRSHGWDGTIEEADHLGTDEKYLKAANPAAVLALIVDAEQNTSAQALLVERNRLQAEVEVLRKDARRWQCVRNAIPMQSPYAVWREGSHVVLGKDADDLVDSFLHTAKEAAQ